MNPTITIPALILGGCLLGSVPFAYLIGRLYGIDIREHGSGNVGATNLGRVLGRGPGFICFVLDFLKGWAPVFVASWLGMPLWVAIAAAVAAILGHSKSVFLGFKGGKSVATGAGAIMALSPLTGALALLVWGVVLALSRFVSLASILAALSLPVWMVLIGEPLAVVGFGVAVAIFVVIRHRSNIDRLRAGTEPKVSRRE